jgi:hypothetical protein
MQSSIQSVHIIIIMETCIIYPEDYSQLKYQCYSLGKYNHKFSKKYVLLTDWQSELTFKLYNFEQRGEAPTELFSSFNSKVCYLRDGFADFFHMIEGLTLYQKSCLGRFVNVCLIPLISVSRANFRLVTVAKYQLITVFTASPLQTYCYPTFALCLTRNMTHKSWIACLYLYFCTSVTS